MSKEFAACLPDWTVRRSELRNEPPVGELEIPIWIDESGSLMLSRIEDSGDERFRLRLVDQLIVDISFGEQLVCEHSISASVTYSTQQHFLIDQVLPRILGHKGKLVLHAAGVRIRDEAVVLLGKSGSGKSSLAASFERAGCSLLGDDALVVSWRGQRAHARAVYPSLRLFPDSIDALFSGSVSTASVAHYTPKLRVSVPLKDEGEPSALPIRAFFVLGAPSSDSEVQVHRKSIAEACMALIENSFLLDPTDKTQAPARLHDTSALAREVPAFDLCYPRAYYRLADVRAAILDALDRIA